MMELWDISQKELQPKWKQPQGRTWPLAELEGQERCEPRHIAQALFSFSLALAWYFSPCPRLPFGMAMYILCHALDTHALCFDFTETWTSQLC